MPENDITSTNQAEATEPAQEITEVGGGEGQAITETEGVQSEQADNTQQEANVLPPELQEKQKELMRDYHAKTQALARERETLQVELQNGKWAVETINKLMAEPWFKTAHANAKKGVVSPEPELSDEQFEQVTQNKQAFMDFVNKVADAKVTNKVSGKFTEHERQIQDMKHEKEFNAAVDKFGDSFKELNDSGSLDKWLKLGHTYKSAYANEMLERGDMNNSKKVQAEAAKMIAAKKAGATHKGGLNH